MRGRSPEDGPSRFCDPRPSRARRGWRGSRSPVWQCSDGAGGSTWTADTDDDLQFRHSLHPFASRKRPTRAGVDPLSLRGTVLLRESRDRSRGGMGDAQGLWHETTAVPEIRQSSYFFQ